MLVLPTTPHNRRLFRCRYATTSTLLIPIRTTRVVRHPWRHDHRSETNTRSQAHQGNQRRNRFGAHTRHFRLYFRQDGPFRKRVQVRPYRCRYYLKGEREQARLIRVLRLLMNERRLRNARIGQTRHGTMLLQQFRMRLRQQLSIRLGNRIRRVSTLRRTMK